MPSQEEMKKQCSADPENASSCPDKQINGILDLYETKCLAELEAGSLDLTLLYKSYYGTLELNYMYCINSGDIYCLGAESDAAWTDDPCSGCSIEMTKMTATFKPKREPVVPDMLEVTDVVKIKLDECGLDLEELRKDAGWNVDDSSDGAGITRANVHATLLTAIGAAFAFVY